MFRCCVNGEVKDCIFNGKGMVIRQEWLYLIDVNMLLQMNLVVKISTSELIPIFYIDP